MNLNRGPVALKQMLMTILLGRFVFTICLLLDCDVSACPR